MTSSKDSTNVTDEGNAQTLPESRNQLCLSSKPKHNILLERFAATADPIPSFQKFPYEPYQFFLYGTLMDPIILQEVLQLPEVPVLKPARVITYGIKLWGQYPALIHGPRDSYVDGVVYVVGTEEHLNMLMDYETDSYRIEGIRIEVDGKRVAGRTFMYAYEESELTEGTWSIEEWKKDVEEEMASHFRPVED